MQGRAGRGAVWEVSADLKRALEIALADNFALFDALVRIHAFVVAGRHMNDSDRTVIADALTRSHPGQALRAELDAARAIVEALRGHRDAGGEVWYSIDRAFEAYDAARRARKVQE